MQKAAFDPGLTQQFTGSLRRVIGKDGSFNVLRRGANWHDFHVYLHLINMRWPLFFGVVVGAYFLVNTLFAFVYYWLGPGQLQGGDASTDSARFLSAFFFSAHTLTTVGYGSIAPKGLAANIVA